MSNTTPTPNPIFSSDIEGDATAAPPAAREREDESREAASKLVQRSNSVQAVEDARQDYLAPGSRGFRATIHDYGAGLVEVSLTRVAGETPREGVDWGIRPAKKKRGSHVLTEDERAIQEARNTARAKTKVRRLVMAAGLDHMVTLTFADNIKDPAFAWTCWTRFVRNLRKETRRAWPYVAVIERQKRGACHFHVAVKGFQNVTLLRRLWQQIVGPLGGGSVNIAFRHGQDRAKLAGYLTKYLTKHDNLRDDGQHRYRPSRGLAIPAETEVIEEIPHTAPIERLHEVFARRGIACMYAMMGDFEDGGFRYAWGCSWGMKRSRNGD